jgi:hypothetical protein
MTAENDHDLPDLQQALAKNWGLPDDSSFSREELHRLLTTRIAQLLNHDWEGLLRIMYRIDVDEKAFHQALEAHTADEQASQIANLMIEREMRKIYLRRKFSGKN